MVGITSFQAYIPPYRLSRGEIARVWSTRSLGGNRAVAKYDEDSLTMAVEAVTGCALQGRRQPDGLFFATTTGPYKEKQAASLLAAAADLSREIRTSDFSGSLRAGSMAIQAAVDAVRGDSAKSIMVACADCRMGKAKSPFEQIFGEGAVALSIGREDVLATIEGSCSISSELLDVWRDEGDSFVRSWEERFAIGEGYLKVMEKVISRVKSEYGLGPKDFSKAVLYGPDGRSHALLAKRLGFDMASQVQDPLFNEIGNTGTAALPLMIVAALGEANPGDLILAANYGDGGDALILKVTENIRVYRQNKGIRNIIERKIPISYERYMNWKGMVAVHEISRPPSPPHSLTCLWRESRAVMALYGSRCLHCGVPQYPAQRVCAECQAKDQLENYRFSDKKGRISAYTVDHLTTNLESPAVMGVVDFEGGGRLMCEVTECEPDEIRVGMPVEMCFRKIGLHGGVHRYFWKARPVVGSSVQ
ncbi:MAG: 3-hydroxy-3-methylglutaryl CoA synthase [Deltaproteobacteria bacterium HGW-Deltaproteobacteria-21]|nr:MAG: 3-hydroxy-3-methylglutaryl CoA synthase [Deltaproteobacteria bacterium HGW-Deltaproteobacteria-21]